MIDIVYVVGKGAKKINDLPLRWSLRSVERFAKNVGRIIVSGYPPDWLSDEVIKVYFEQTHKKHVNMLLSIAAAVEIVNLQNLFLYSSDDHYFCKPVNLEKWPIFIRGQLPTIDSYKKLHPNRPLTKYAATLIATRNILTKFKLSTIRFAVHANTWIDPSTIEDAVKISLQYKNTAILGLEFTCLLGALREKQLKKHGINLVSKYKTLFDQKVNTVKQLKQRINKNYPMFTTTPNAEENPEIVNFLNNFYNKKSKYEK